MSAPRAHALAGIYQADAGLLGELRYLAGRLKGAHCALCDISHTLRGERADFESVRARLRLQTFHLNDQPVALAAATAGRTPCVAARTSEGWQVLLEASALTRCGRSIDAFEAAVLDALRAAGLTLDDARGAAPESAG